MFEVEGVPSSLCSGGGQQATAEPNTTLFCLVRDCLHKLCALGEKVVNTRPVLAFDLRYVRTSGRRLWKLAPMEHSVRVTQVWSCSSACHPGLAAAASYRVCCLAFTRCSCPNDGGSHTLHAEFVMLKLKYLRTVNA